MFGLETQAYVTDSIRFMQQLQLKHISHACVCHRSHLHLPTRTAGSPSVVSSSNVGDDSDGSPGGATSRLLEADV